MNKKQKIKYIENLEYINRSGGWNKIGKNILLKYADISEKEPTPYINLITMSGNPKNQNFDKYITLKNNLLNLKKHK